MEKGRTKHCILVNTGLFVSPLLTGEMIQHHWLTFNRIITAICRSSAGKGFTIFIYVLPCTFTYCHAYLWTAMFIFVLPFLVYDLPGLSTNSHVYLRIFMFIYVLRMFTYILPCLHTYCHVHLCAAMFVYVLPCLFTYCYVHLRTDM